MAIKAKCEKCAARFQAKDELAGKRVKCPKCGEPMRISDAPAVAAQAAANAGVRSAPAANPAATRRPPANFAGAAGFSARRDNPLLDLLDEAGVESMPSGPLCTHCGAEMGATAIICVECGFNMATGKQLVTDTYGHDPLIDGDLTDGQKLLARAEKEIDDSPITAVGQDFGDGADSMLIAVVALVVMGVLVGIGVGVIFLMDQISESINSAKISFFASIGIYARVRNLDHDCRVSDETTAGDRLCRNRRVVLYRFWIYAGQDALNSDNYSACFSCYRTVVVFLCIRNPQCLLTK